MDTAAQIGIIAVALLVFGVCMLYRRRNKDSYVGELLVLNALLFGALAVGAVPHEDSPVTALGIESSSMSTQL